MRDLDAEVVVVGAGPAGIAAAIAAAESGAPVLLIDDNTAPGGQIWRRASTGPAAPWLKRLNAARVEILGSTTVVALDSDRALLCESPDGPVRVAWKSLILCCGARELFLPFKGWTLPGVVGAGALQALAKNGLSLRDKRVLVAGSGPLLPAVAASLRSSAGARIVAIAEQAPTRRVLSFAAWLATLGIIEHPSKLAQAAALRARLLTVPYWTGSWPASASPHSAGGLEVLVRSERSERRVTCDYLACGFGLVPNLSLPRLLGCIIRDGDAVAVGAVQDTSVQSVYAAGELCGIGGVECALTEGRIAGLAAAGKREAAAALSPRRSRPREFARRLARVFALRPELRSIADDSTILCRCEDTTLGQARAFSSWREAKLLSRCGMGPCQGRTCGPAAEFLLGWHAADTRPPLAPASLSTLAALTPPSSSE